MLDKVHLENRLPHIFNPSLTIISICLFTVSTAPPSCAIACLFSTLPVLQLFFHHYSQLPCSRNTFLQCTAPLFMESSFYQPNASIGHVVVLYSTQAFFPPTFYSSNVPAVPVHYNANASALLCQCQCQCQCQCISTNSPPLIPPCPTFGHKFAPVSFF